MFPFLVIFTNTGYYYFFIVAILMGMRWHLTVDLICTLLMTGASLIAQLVNNLLAMQETPV